MDSQVAFSVANNNLRTELSEFVDHAGVGEQLDTGKFVVLAEEAEALGVAVLGFGDPVLNHVNRLLGILADQGLNPESVDVKAGAYGAQGPRLSGNLRKIHLQKIINLL